MRYASLMHSDRRCHLREEIVTAQIREMFAYFPILCPSIWILIALSLLARLSGQYGYCMGQYDVHDIGDHIPVSGDYPYITAPWQRAQNVFCANQGILIVVICPFGFGRTIQRGSIIFIMVDERAEESGV